ncbi:O-methyltransferase [bacterium]|nr:O-methyltransferase [candidate division CSSED10-310 bacterium]
MGKTVPDPKSYFMGFIPSRDRLLLEMEAEALREGIPIIGPVVGEFLHILIRTSKAKRILDLGTATGYSAIYLARAAGPDGMVVTVERDEFLSVRAWANIERAGLGGCVDIQVGAAGRIMKKLKPPFDLIFLDIDKHEYDGVLPHCHRLLHNGGLLVCDNVSFATAAAFNREVFNNGNWRTVHLFSFLPMHSPEDDALCLAMKVR